MVYDLFVIFGWIVLAAFFSGVETGFYTLNRLRLQVRHYSAKDVRAGLVHRLLMNPGKLIAALLVGTNISVYFATATLVEIWKEHGLPHPSIYCALIMAPLLLVIAEIVPKNLFRERSDTLVYNVAGVTRFFSIIFYPVVIILSWLGKLFALPFRRKGAGAEDDSFWSRAEFRHIIAEGVREGALTKYQNEIAKNIMRLRHVTVDKIMVPLDKVYLLEAKEPVSRLLELVRQTGHFRFPVYAEKKEAVTGFVNVFDHFYGRPGSPALNETDPVKKLERTTVQFFVNTPLDSVLFLLQNSKQQMGIVRDMDDNAIGIVTISDVINGIIMHENVA